MQLAFGPNRANFPAQGPNLSLTNKCNYIYNQFINILVISYSYREWTVLEKSGWWMQLQNSWNIFHMNKLLVLLKYFTLNELVAKKSREPEKKSSKPSSGRKQSPGKKQHRK